MSYAVIQVQLSYDFIEGVDFIAKFDTEEQADAFKDEKVSEQREQWVKKCNYINNWVEAIEVPQTDYNEWREFCEKYHPFAQRHIRPQEFKEAFKDYLKKYRYTFEGYNPPECHFKWNNLFVVEIH